MSAFNGHAQSSPATAQQAERFLDAIRERDGAAARRLLDSYPALARASIHAAAAACAADIAADLIRLDPSVAVLPDTHAWPPLAYACATTLHQISPSRADAQLATARLLLDAGAGANSVTVWRDENNHAFPIPVLYHACMSNHVGIVALLLERGATTNDGESIYHAAEHNRRECLELMERHGADFSSRHVSYGNTPLFFLSGHHDDEGGNAAWAQGTRWLLEHGADPNVTSGDHESTPLHALATGGRHQVLLWVIEFGAGVNAVRRDGRTPYAIALRSGNAIGAAYLVEHGARAALVTPVDDFLGACLASDEAQARALLRRHPELIELMSSEGKEALANAVRGDRHDAIRLMIDMGFELSWEEPEGGTPLHLAAWLGNVAMVKLLLSLGAPVNARDGRFGSSPMGWAAHGSRFAADGKADERYCDIIDLLVGAGASRKASINKWGEPPEGMATERVAERLAERGFVPPTPIPER